MSPCVDLAEPLRIRDFAGSLGEYIDYLESEYRAIVGDPGVTLWGMPVRAEGGQAADGRDVCFWHLITRQAPGGTENDRFLDLFRASLVPRVRDLLERLARDDPRACWWPEREKHGRSSVHVASVDFGLHVVLRRAGPVFMLRTAWPLVAHGTRARLMARAARGWEADGSR